MKSGNGWVASKDPAEIHIRSYAVKGTKIKLRAAIPAGKLLAAFAAEFHEQVEPIDEGTLDDWGYCFRLVRGGTTLSNHSSGTAIDLNASKHPLGKVGTFTKEQSADIRELCAKYGLRWGGDYNGRKDEMHFEITENHTDVMTRIEALGL